MLQESTLRVSTAEDNVKKVAEAEKPLSVENSPIEDAIKALGDLEAAVTAATNAAGNAKTFLAMKRLAAKRLGEAARNSTNEALVTLQERLNAASATLAERKKGMLERKTATIKREIVAAMQEAEKKIEEAADTTKGLTNVTEMSAEDMKNACEKAAASQKQAQGVVDTTRSLLQSRQREAKAACEAGSPLLSEVSKHLEQCTKLQAALDKQCRVLREQEHKFVAQRLLKDAIALVDGLEKKLETTTEKAAPLASDDLGEVTGLMFLSYMVDILKQYASATKKSTKELFAELSENTGKLNEVRFVKAMTKLLEREENKDLFFSEDQQKAAFRSMLMKDGGAEISEAEFAPHFRSRYMVSCQVSMTDHLTVKGGKTVRKLEENEVVEALEEPVKEGAGLLRVKARAEKDDKQGYVTISGNQGTLYLETYSQFTASQKEIDSQLQELADTAKEALRYIESKTDELKSARLGPLAETKAELLKMRPRISRVTQSQTDLRQKVTASQKKLSEIVEAEKRSRLEAMEKKAAAALLEEITAAEAQAKSDVEKTASMVEALVKNGSVEGDDPLADISKAEKEVEAAASSVDSATSLINEKLSSTKGAGKGPLGEARSTLVKLKVSLGSIDSRCKKLAASLKAASSRIAPP